MSEKDPNELGALWEKTSDKGVYMTGTIGGQSVVVFKNHRKTGKQPDWRVLKSRRDYLAVRESRPKPSRSEADDGIDF